MEYWAACFAAPTEKEENRAVKYDASGAQLLENQACVSDHILLAPGDLQRRDAPQLLEVRFRLTARPCDDFSALHSAEKIMLTSLHCAFTVTSQVQERRDRACLCGAGPLITFKFTGICRKLSFVQKEAENFCIMIVSIWQRSHFTTYLVKKSSFSRAQSVFCVPI